jgi:hypothetical protein
MPILEHRQAAVKAFDTRLIRNWFGTVINPLRNWSTVARVQPIWVPGHRDVESNEATDQLTIPFSERPSVGPNENEVSQ